MGRLNCEDCRSAYAPHPFDTPEDKERKKNGPPCAKCQPGVLPGNREAVDVYMRCQDQLIMGFGGPVGIKVEAVMAVMGLWGVKDQRGCLDKVQIIARTSIGAQQAEAARKREERESSGKGSR